jgi:hypothetical protein
MRLYIACLRRFALIAAVCGVATVPLLARPAVKPGPAEAIDRAGLGLVAQIEDDVAKKGDWIFASVRTIGCTSVVTARPLTSHSDTAQGQWTIDWAVAESARLHYNFVHIKAPGVRFNIVGDGKKKATRKLGLLADAMQVKMRSCSTQRI